jgi:hypothetical protein
MFQISKMTELFGTVLSAVDPKINPIVLSLAFSAKAGSSESGGKFFGSHAIKPIYGRGCNWNRQNF